MSSNYWVMGECIALGLSMYIYTYSALQDGRVDIIQPILLAKMFGWSCWRFNMAVQVLQEEQEVFYTIDVDPRGRRWL